jgi:hypothetical protein
MNPIVFDENFRPLTPYQTWEGVTLGRTLVSELDKDYVDRQATNVTWLFIQEHLSCRT